jgi:hypothetical protein
MQNRVGLLVIRRRVEADSEVNLLTVQKLQIALTLQPLPSTQQTMKPMKAYERKGYYV